MTIADIDDMLRDLEKDVQDFTLSMTDQQVISGVPAITALEQHHPHYRQQPVSPDNVPLRLYATSNSTTQQSSPPAPHPHAVTLDYMTKHKKEGEEEEEEEISLGRLLQRSATTRPTASNTNSTAPTKLLQTSKSLKSATGRDQFRMKKSLGTEADNSAVQQSSLQPSISSSSTATTASSLSSSAHSIPPVPSIPAMLSNTSTNASAELAGEDDLRFAMHRAWAVLDGQPSTNKSESAASATAAMLEETIKSPTQSSFQQQQHHHHPSSGLHHSTSVKRSNHPATGATSNLKAVNTRIFINDAKTYKAVQLTNILTTAMVVQYLKRKGLIDPDSDDWTLFEIDNQHGVERPLREWEIPYEIVNNWDLNTNNALLVKKYNYHYTLTPESLFERKVPPMQGFVCIEYKKGKWQKKYCFIKDNAIQYAKDSKTLANASILCHLASYDVYTLLQPLTSTTPSPFVIAIRAQDKSTIFEREGDYMRFLAIDDPEKMKNWVLSLRCARSQIQYQYSPQRITNPLAHMATHNNGDGLRRNKSTKDLHTTAGFSRSESTRRPDNEQRHLTRSNTTSKGTSLSRSATTQAKMTDTANSSSGSEGGTLIDCTEHSTFSKGSLLAKEETHEQILYRQQQQQQQQQELHEEASSPSNTLIQIDDRVKFAKGSLLDKKMSRSKSVRDVANTSTTTHAAEEGGQLRSHASIRRRPTAASKRPQQHHHDVPLPNNAAIASLPSSNAAHHHHYNGNTNGSNGTLLKLDDTPEKNHSRQLHNRHVKPLLEF
ncbi:hypothetical protein BDF20DRAFT_908659 [Mycotypha africana]|uniref:uncharacterized protein n=1 Tax=Mycotypha africana TaxID=64632 RepID=UPI002301E05B|nr:uncharacterized protein BDF20DRAFT_908659 [Mycotypha africana]KAI8990813.1 hypothetical protein BDF20DRAFT_908659 [Mycotypha africana]